MTRGRVVVLLLFLGIAGFALAALPWLQLTVPTVIATQEVSVAGTTAAPAIGATSLAVLAAALAVAISGTVVRRIAGVAIVVLGVLVAVTAVQLVRDPEPVALAEASAISGVPQLAGDVTVTPWPYLTVLLGALVAACGVVVVTARTWAAGQRRYERATTPDAAAHGPAPATGPRVQAMDDWDALGRGEDPTTSEHG